MTPLVPAMPILGRNNGRRTSMIKIAVMMANVYDSDDRNDGPDVNYDCRM